MTENLKEAILGYAERLEKLANQGTLSTEQTINRLQSLGKMMTQEVAYLYEEEEN
jgi:hypothetical protein